MRDIFSFQSDQQTASPDFRQIDLDSEASDGGEAIIRKNEELAESEESSETDSEKQNVRSTNKNKAAQSKQEVTRSGANEGGEVLEGPDGGSSLDGLARRTPNNKPQQNNKPLFSETRNGHDKDGARRSPLPDKSTPSSLHDNPESTSSSQSFQTLGVCEELCLACESLGWKSPTEIQIASIPHALNGKDIIGLAQTGSGKTGSFAIPIIQTLLATPNHKGVFALVLAPTRELSVQIADHFRALGAAISLRVCVLVGGLDMGAQMVELAKKPHVIVATPGRILDHLEHTKGFSLVSLNFLVMDEADRLLSMDFEEALNQILEVVPKNRRTFLFSATMTSRVSKLQRASLVKPVKVSQSVS